MKRKVYLKPKSRCIYIDAKSTILTGSNDTEIGQGEDNEPHYSKRHNFLWEDDEEDYSFGK